MITYISSSNADKYNLLFDKASKALIANPPENREDEFSDNFAITTLNEYFAYLEDLVKTSTDEDISRFFVRLPLDEDFFEIDANSRTIKVPGSSFGRYGVGVQGDELAEVVYFVIDRYFDSTDLASKEINIVIQWEAKDANKKTIAGISQHFGKDIETIPGKIIFGWPISHELTAAAGNIKFAVRFYQLGESDENDARQLVYSFSTLPAEVSINSSLNYDLINHSVKEIDHGKIITNRIRNAGTYDPSAPIPGEPIVTIPLYVISPEGNELVKIVDLPADENSEVKLAISAKNSDIGKISYDWRKFSYNSASGSYEADSVEIKAIEYKYQEEIPDSAEDLPSVDQEYYTVTFDEGNRVTAANLVTKDRIQAIEIGSKVIPAEEEGEEEQVVFFFRENGAEIHLYKKLSVASVNTVGEYSVDVKARTSVNTTVRKMDKDERIRIPGPLKPVINLPEEGENVSVTEDDKVTHVISSGNAAVLTANAVAGEAGKSPAEVGENPQVTLDYNWKKVSSDGVETDIVASAPTMPVAALPVAQLPDDPAWLENTEEDGVPGAKGIFNQEHIKIVQSGSNVVIYPDSELKFYESTDSAQGRHQWIAIDIDSGKDSLEGVTWGDGVHEATTFTSEAENELGVANGHIVFWFKADEASAPNSVTRYINNKPLTFQISMDAPSNVQYSFNGDKSEITLVGLPAEGLDDSYVVEVKATRNKVSTTEKSGKYRVTNAPKAPVLSYAGQPVDTVIHAVDKQDFRGNYNSLSFNIEEPALSDGITYLWMHGIVDNEADYDDYKQIKAQIDLDGALAAILGNTEFPGTKDEICDADVAHYEDGEIVFGASSGNKTYQLKAEDNGIYYCIVINELNNNKAASVGPFFKVN